MYPGLSETGDLWADFTDPKGVRLDPSQYRGGSGRNSTGEFVQFLGIAKGSLAELETLLLLSKDLGFLEEDESQKLFEACEEKASC